MQKESIHIQNFAGINDLKIDVNSITVMIGPQASGKSLTAKLLFYCKSFFRQIYYEFEKGRSLNFSIFYYEHKFSRYFPPSSWGNHTFTITYNINDSWIKITKENNEKVVLDFSEKI
ncbi:MAG: hypothetical protein AAGI38_15805, partial [Bacteroidota bacterium]